MQDEPERGPGFSRKMSLKAKIGMLGIAHQHGRFEARSLEQIQAFLARAGGNRLPHVRGYFTAY